MHFCDAQLVVETTVSCFHLSLRVPAVKGSGIQRLSPMVLREGPGAYHLYYNHIDSYLTFVKPHWISIHWLFDIYKTKDTFTFYVFLLVFDSQVNHTQSNFVYVMAYVRSKYFAGHTHTILACLKLIHISDLMMIKRWCLTIFIIIKYH